jgi:hypothetical protein
MGRASGRKNTTPRQPVPGSPEGDDIGLSTRQDPGGSPIPGLTGNIANYETVRQKPATPDESFDEFRGIMAHGVPNDSETTNERALQERDGTVAKQHRPPTPPELGHDRVLPSPIPVYITTLNAGGRPLGTISTVKVNVPGWGTGADPVRIAGRDLDRTKMLLMVETAAGAAGAAPTGIRVSKEISILANAESQGALMRSGMSAYQDLDNQQDEMFAISNDGSACTLSVIYLYGETAGA